MSGTETLSTSTTSRRTGGGWGSVTIQWASSQPPTWRPSRSSEYNLYCHILRDSLVTIILSFITIIFINIIAIVHTLHYSLFILYIPKSTPSIFYSKIVSWCFCYE